MTGVVSILPQTWQDNIGPYLPSTAGAALYGVMSDLVFRTTSTDRTVVEAVIQAADKHEHRQGQDKYEPRVSR